MVPRKSQSNLSLARKSKDALAVWDLFRKIAFFKPVHYEAVCPDGDSFRDFRLLTNDRNAPREVSGEILVFASSCLFSTYPGPVPYNYILVKDSPTDGCSSAYLRVVHDHTLDNLCPLPNHYPWRQDTVPYLSFDDATSRNY